MNPKNTRDQSGEVTGNIEASESLSQSSIPEPIRAARAAMTGLLMSAMVVAGSSNSASANVELNPVSLSAGEIAGTTFSPSSILGGLGIIQNGDGNYAVAGREALSAEDQAQLDAFIAQVERFTEDFTEALTSASPVTGVHPRERDENPSMIRLAEVFHTLDSNQKISLITSYNGAGERETALREAFAHVLPAHLGARRGELEERYGQSMIAALRMQDNPQYTELHETEGLYFTVLTAIIERLEDTEDSKDFKTNMTPEIFYQLLDDIDREVQNGTYAEVDRFELILAGVYDRLMKGEGNINQRMLTIIEPVLREEYARLHPELQEFYEVRTENIRTAEERQRTAEELEATRETARAIRDMLGS
ncbi:hypothetical protein LAT59_04920 [Candidatus Gracilibacteria bacterium]|nr:hypothetical protein [Candidatus Gracilibacteria bacterium]